MFGNSAGFELKCSLNLPLRNHLGRFNEPRHSVAKTNIKSKLITVAERFLPRNNYCCTDIQLILLELISSSRDSIKTARENRFSRNIGTQRYE